MASARRKKTSKKKIIVILIIIAVVIALVAAAVVILKHTVSDKFGDSSESEIETANVTKGNISTTVTGSGSLENEEATDITIPEEVEVDEIYVNAGDKVEKGDMLAAVDAISVQEAMANVQEQIDDLDAQLADIEEEEVEDTITAGVSGRIKKIYAKSGTDVSTTMYKNEALMLISMDGYMAVDIETDNLKKGDSVTVTTSNKKEYTGEVDSVWDGTATVVITDNGTKLNDKVTVQISDDESATGNLYIHQQVEVTGYTGTVKSISVSNNEKVSKDDTLIILDNVTDTVDYKTILEKRKDQEEELKNLVTIYKEGAVYATKDGIITSITESDEDGSGSIITESSNYGFSASGDGMSSGTVTTSTSDEDSDTVISIASTEKMYLDVNIDEADILSLSVGQKAEVTIDSLEDETFDGSITEIDKTGASSSGVTSYSATVVIERTDEMLEGMSASAVITIEGKDNALLLPEDAVTKTSSSSYVYTSYDEETGELGDMTEVTIGISNGTYIEITDGLKEGDTIYYQSKEDDGFSFENMGGGMQFPGGMDMGGSSGMPQTPNNGDTNFSKKDFNKSQK